MLRNKGCGPATSPRPLLQRSRTSRRRITTVCRRAKAPPATPSHTPPQSVVGIDLGTSNSAVAVVKRGRANIVPIHPEGSRTLPSVVSVTEDLEGRQILTGISAKRAATRLPKDTFYSSKRFIGKSFEQVGQQAARVAFDVAVGEEEGELVFQCSAGQVTPEQVAAYIVQRLLASVEARGFGEVTRAVISVPAYFDDAQREATRLAGMQAGLETVKLIREPVAAALAYGIDAQRDQTILVLDLGGGTFDVSLLEVGGGIIEVLATGGDAQLGGDDWDDAIVQWLGKLHLGPLGLDWRRPGPLSMLRNIAESAKIQLSTSMRVSLKIPIPASKAPDKGATTASTAPLEVVLTRGQLEKLAAPLYKRMREAINSACWQAGVDLELVLEEQRKFKQAPGRGLIQPKGRPPVSQVLLVGGAMRMPGVQQLVRNMTGIDAKEFVVDPDEAVALGAAIQAGICEGSIKGMAVMDIWQAALARAFARDKYTKGEDQFEDFDMDFDADSNFESDSDLDSDLDF